MNVRIYVVKEQPRQASSDSESEHSSASHSRSGGFCCFWHCMLAGAVHKIGQITIKEEVVHSVLGAAVAR